MSEKQDSRQWQTLSLPDEVANEVYEAVYLAEVSGEAANRIEGFRAVATYYRLWALERLMEQVRKGVKTVYHVNVLTAYINAGWRCLNCGTSRHLTPHHGIPQGQQGSDDETNLFPLCVSCHERITNPDHPQWHWKAALPILREIKAQAKGEVEANGGTWRHKPKADRLRLPPHPKAKERAEKRRSSSKSQGNRSPNPDQEPPDAAASTTPANPSENSPAG